MSSQFRYVIPGQSWYEASQNIQRDIKAANEAGDAYPIAEVFKHIKLTDTNRQLEEELKRRGSFDLHNDGTYQNRGTPIAKAVSDIHQDLGRVGIYIPRIVKLTVSDDLIIRVSDERRHRVVLSFRDRPPTGGFGRRFTLQDIRFDVSGVSYRFVDQSDEQRTLLLFVDYNAERPLLRKPEGKYHAGDIVELDDKTGFQVASIISSRAVMDGPCDCCEPFPPVKPCQDPGGPLVVRIHAKVLMNPTRTIADQVAAVNTVYAAADIRCELVTTQNLNLPHLLHYDAGRCTSLSNPPDQQEISGYRDNAGSMDIVVYWVNSITSDTGSLAGCASSPPGRPMVVMARSTSQWVLGHEIGHVLDLGHTPTNSDTVIA